MKRIKKFILKTVLLFLALSILPVIAYRFLPVYITPLMVIRHVKNDSPIHHKWTPIENISPHLIHAVVASEDNLFLTHRGFDTKAIREAIGEAKKGNKNRGASTITQQTAKNIFLWPNRSWVRKGLEAYFTILIEIIWSKERIMEVYLNSIEMGNGIYGAWAVAEQHFNTTPDKLTRSQCALIAGSLPNPLIMSSKKPSPYLLRRQSAILRNMNNIGRVKFEQK